MKITLLVLFAFLSLVFEVSAAEYSGSANFPKGVVATVNGVNIPQALLDNNVKLNVEKGGQKDRPEFRKVILD